MTDLTRTRIGVPGKGRIKDKGRECERNHQTIKEDYGGLEIPVSLSTVEFLEAWKEWVEYRTEAGKKYHWVTTSRCFRKSLQKCEQWGIERSIAAIDISIEMGWRGLFESRNPTKPTNGELVDGLGFILDPSPLGGPPRRRRDAQGNFIRAQGR